MTKQEYIEWAMEDILVPLSDNVDIIVSWFVGSKDCRCPITKQINDAVYKLINRYDIVIFDCEFDLKYLNQLVDTEMDCTIIVAKPSEESAHLAKRIEEFSAKYSAGNQLGVIINKADGSDLNNLYEFLKSFDLDVLGVIPIDTEMNSLEKFSQINSSLPTNNFPFVAFNISFTFIILLLQQINFYYYILIHLFLQ